MAEALKRVKAELGPSAVILHTRTFHRGGWLGFGRRNVVEVTAANDVNIVPPKLRRAVLEDTPVAPPPRRIAGSAVAGAYGQPAPAASPATARPTPEIVVPTQQAMATPGGAVNEDITQIRMMVQQMMRRQSARPPQDLPDVLFNQYLALLEREVTEELADEVVQSVRGKLNAKELNDAGAVREAVRREIAELVPVDVQSPHRARPADGRPLTIALVGPTGVGKTTTIAKLAATFKLREKKKVALITIDTYRIAAVDQLRTYADIIQVLLHVALTPAEMKAAIRKCADCDVVLIDTAGRGQRDDAKLSELRKFIDAANPHEVHLVLSSTCCQSVLMEAVERFAHVRTDRVIFTKLDEAVSLGVVLNVVRRVNKQLSYITTGQEVPHQIEPGCSNRLAQLILGEGL